jgi:DNA-binding NarL/FixJ family response regulator
MDGLTGPPGRTGPTVVLADDHVMVAEALRGLLEPEFEVVAVVADGLALLDAARRLRPDVVLADLAMPGLSGLEAARRLAQEGVPSRVVILTMHAEAALAAAALRAGAVGFVAKHAGAAELLEAVRAASRVRPGGGATGRGTGRPGAAHGEDLSPRQREILRLLAGGLTMRAIGARLGVSVRTVETHKYEAMHRLGVATTAALIRYAVAAGLAAGRDETTLP